MKNVVIVLTLIFAAGSKVGVNIGPGCLFAVHSNVISKTMKKILLLACLLFLSAGIASGLDNIPDGKCLIPEDRRHNTDWFSKSRWGVFVHYLWGLQNAGNHPNNMGKTTDWDTCVKEFDTEKFADQVKETGASYVIFTMMQRTRYLIAPNDIYDRLTGYKPGEACSTRDLVEDLYQSLHKRGIILMLYFTGDGPRADAQAAKGMGYANGTPVEFVKNWASVAAEYGRRYKDKVAGYWVDGCYGGGAANTGYNEEKWTILANGLREGNPKRIIALNSPTMSVANSFTLNDDYTTGEVNTFGETSAFRWRDGVQWHVLSFLGRYWGAPGVRYSPDWMVDYIRRANFSGGVITVDVMLYRDGSIDAAQRECLRKASEKMRALESGKPLPPDNLAYGKPADALYADGHQSRGVAGSSKTGGANYAFSGVDGDPNTVAQASSREGDPLSWAYEVDLQKAARLDRVVVTFGKAGYATDFKIAVSTDGENWTDVYQKQNHDGSKVDVKITPVEARYIRIIGLKPDAPNQPGKQMQIAELEAYATDR